MEKEYIEQRVLESYRNINFIKRYKNISLEFDNDLDEVMKRMDKRENLKILRSFSYPFKISSPGQLYLFEEIFSDIKLKFITQISKGFITPYIYIYIKNEKVETLDWLSGIYRIMMDDENAYITIPSFKSFEELWQIMSELLKVYEDFRDEFLKNMEDLEV